MHPTQVPRSETVETLAQDWEVEGTTGSLCNHPETAQSEPEDACHYPYGTLDLFHGGTPSAT